MTKELVAIQYLRGMAVVLVVLHHLASGELEYLLIPHWGEFGVAIFFVISGFIMWHTTATLNTSAVEFWRRRIIRIVPLYWICLAALIIVALSAPRLLNTTAITPENTIKSFLFIPHFHAVQKQLIAPLVIPGWSLNYEMFFYLLFGFSLLVRPPLHRSVLLGVILLALVASGLVFRPTGAIASTYTSAKLLTFLDGIVLAMIYGTRWMSGLTLGVVLISIGLLSNLVPDSSDLGALGSFLGLSPTLIVAGALALEFAARRSPSVVFHAIGNASYSIYLSHLFFLRIVELAWRHFASFGSSRLVDVTYAALAFISAIGGGIAVHYLIERPILVRLQKRHVAAKGQSR